ncbi:hypothetical protein CBM2586_B10587 [Cupriavidus phytorum]|uniref:Uncharacterized protein n=1 Tax=Cupriavidus taiwanensis TaxID=164546 RepID=A0A375CA51_9BURK|nr:hypothetical protein CBM2586_B10587 [Cupriavidus taiwanensis]
MTDAYRLVDTAYDWLMTAAIRFPSRRASPAVRCVPASSFDCIKCYGALKRQ